MDHAYRSRYELWGGEGRITVDRAFTPPAGHRPRIEVEDASGARTVELPAEDQVAATLAAFTAAVRGKDSASAGEELRDLLAQADLLAAIRRAAAGQEPAVDG
jgi:hypothetical protein